MTKTERDALTDFLAGRLVTLRIDPDGRLARDAPLPRLLLPGSFNPLHEGHLQLAYTVARQEGSEAAFELSIANADKPLLADVEVRRRLAQFTGRGAVWLTRAPTFVEKGRLFPGTVFVLGADTADRVVAPRFYQDSEAQRDAALDELRVLGCRFLVAPRADRAGKLLRLEELVIPSRHRDLFREVMFRHDISSTQLRQQG